MQKLFNKKERERKKKTRFKPYGAPVEYLAS